MCSTVFRCFYCALLLIALLVRSGKPAHGDHDVCLDCHKQDPNYAYVTCTAWICCSQSMVCRVWTLICKRKLLRNGTQRKKRKFAAGTLRFFSTHSVLSVLLTRLLRRLETLTGEKLEGSLHEALKSGVCLALCAFPCVVRAHIVDQASCCAKLSTQSSQTPSRRSAPWPPPSSKW